MKYFYFLLLFSSHVFAQSAMDDLKWFLHPQGQEILISIDDLHDEKIPAVPEMNWGFESVAQQEFKKDILIAVIDGGMEIEHPDFKDVIAYNEADCFNGNIIPPMTDGDKDGNGYKGDCAGWNFVDANNRPEDLDGHGTHVAGIIASVLKSQKGHFKLLPLKVFAPGEGTRSVKSDAPLAVRLLKAFEYAMARKVDVIHMSVGWPKSFMSFELENTIKKAIDQGILVVAAAGNSSQRATIIPCQMEGVICVGALRPNGEVARFSNWGSQVDLFAPGEKILSSIPSTVAPQFISRRGYDFKNGTSQAAPFISAALGVLRGVFPEETSSALYSRLMLTAGEGTKAGGLKGLFHLDRALTIVPQSFVFPQLKGLHHILVEGKSFKVDLKFKNHWMDEEKELSVKFTCTDAVIESTSQTLSMATESILSFQGSLQADVNEISCEISLASGKIPLKLKVQRPLNPAIESIIARQEDLYVISTRQGARSRFMTLDALKGSHVGPLYSIAKLNTFDIYQKDVKLGTIPTLKDCSVLRVMQGDLDGDGNNDLLVQSLCEKTYLQYRFLDLRFQNILPVITYRPALAVNTYEDYEMILTPNEPPKFRFMFEGLGVPATSAWESQTTGKKVRLYEMFPKKNKDAWEYDIRILEEPKKWMKSLGLRVRPSYSLIYFKDNKLLVQFDRKAAWINIATQEASWADYDDTLLKGSRKQELISAPGEIILQSFLTPYEYRGALLDKIKLRYVQIDRFDPLIDILGTQKNALGYLTVLRSFQNLIYVQYDAAGNKLTEKKSIVDRFDFLTAQDLISSVINLSINGHMIQIVDGTKINTNYIDVMTEAGKTSYEIPDKCATQQPVELNGKLALPIFCGKSKTEFEMRFIEI